MSFLIVHWKSARAMAENWRRVGAWVQATTIWVRHVRKRGAALHTCQCEVPQGQRDRVQWLHHQPLASISYIGIEACIAPNPLCLNNKFCIEQCRVDNFSSYPKSQLTQSLCKRLWSSKSTVCTAFPYIHHKETDDTWNHYNVCKLGFCLSVL